MRPKNFVTSYRGAHLAIEKTVNRIFGVIRSYPAARRILPDLNEQFSAHLRRQDNQFYLKIREHFARDHHALKMIEFLEVDTKNIKLTVFEFFDKYSSDSSDIAARNFPIDFRRFADEIQIRIVTEKDYLLPLLTDFCGHASIKESI